MGTANILVIDDEETIRELIATTLELDGYKVFQAETATKGLEILQREEIRLVILDVKLPDVDGVELVTTVKVFNPFIEVIVLTAYGTIQDGVRAIKNGAFDYITKGADDNDLHKIVERALEKSDMRYRIEQLEQKVSSKFSFENVIGSSRALIEAVNVAKKVSNSDSPVLLLGETGTGKEIFAQAIHYSSPRRQKPFVAINCSAIARELLESEMFGYRAGAFTGAQKNKKGLFEEAHEGTIFLDEIGEMDIALQAKMLRVLESKSFIKPGDTKTTEVDVRIIAATNRDLMVEIDRGAFRADLFYRIGVMKIDLPPLKDRKDDIVTLAYYFIKMYSERLGKNINDIDVDFIEKLKQYDFPGNIRELRNVIERSVLLSDGNKIRASVLPKEFHKSPIFESVGTPELLPLEEVEKRHIKYVLQSASYNKTKASEILGIGITTLYRKLQQYNIGDK